MSNILTQNWLLGRGWDGELLRKTTLARFAYSLAVRHSAPYH